MDNAKQQLVEKLKSASNILVTVRTSPSVDELAACLGLTLLVNKLGKHGTAVFSGEIPSTIEFLEPERTIEKNTDSLQDFIIALDKSKADKLRYKVEDQVVKIFITPYKTAIDENDLEFSQGDFNVDVVVALGVREQADLDQAITSHGRILHDASVVSINTEAASGLGDINWSDPAASSLSELVAEASKGLGKDLLDEQIATALLTGIVSETDRFSNEKTSARTMTVSAELMGAGANQQLVVAKLDEPPPEPETPPEDDDENSSGGSAKKPAKNDDGTLEIDHSRDPEPEPEPEAEEPMPEEPEPPEENLPPEEAELPDKPLEDTNPTTPQDYDEGYSPDSPKLTDVKAVFADAAPEEKSRKNSGTYSSPESADTAPTDGKNPWLVGKRSEELAPGLDPLAAPGASQSFLASSDEDVDTSRGSSKAPDVPLPTKTQVPSPDPPSAAQLAPPTSSQALDNPESGLPASSSALPPSVDEGAHTLEELEREVRSPHLTQAGASTARDKIETALDSDPNSSLKPVKSLGVQPLGQDLHIDKDGNLVQPAPPSANEPAPSSASPADTPLDMPMPLSPSFSPPPPQFSEVSNPTAPPPVPPPMMPPAVGGLNPS